MQKLSRLESSKEVRRVLNRHGVDLTMCQYTCSGREVRMTGRLCRTDGSEYGAGHIEAMLYDFARHLNGYTIQGELDNWRFSSDHITNLGGDENQDQESGNSGEESYEEVS